MRADLLALTPEALAAMSNLGLVKRAQRELEQGRGPALAEDGAGTVTGAFEDGVVTRLPAGVALRDAPCSCPSTAVCRHRVAVALAYRSFHEARQGLAPSSDEAASTVAETPAAFGAWSPSDFTDEALERHVGARGHERARRTRAAGLTVEVVREGPVTAARLPSCTVRFLVPGDLAWARCDCQAGIACEHVALAVWAFREADREERSAVRRVVSLGEPRAARPATELATSVRLAEELALDGVTSSGEAVSGRLERTARALENAGATWPALALLDLVECLSAYRRRSSLYAASDVTALLAELLARDLASACLSGALPAGAVLGQGEALETRLDHLRLVSLGARVLSDGDDREARVYLADPDSAVVLVLSKRWPKVEGEAAPDGPALGPRRVASGGVTLARLAAGQLVTRVARRRANRALVLGEARGGLTSVVPHAGDFSALPEPLRVTRLSQLQAIFDGRPPRILRPRVLAEDVHVLEVASVDDLAFDPAGQRLTATLCDADGETALLSRPYRSVSPNALEHLAAALSGSHGPVRAVAGFFERHLGAFRMDPLAVGASRLVVPDLEPGVPEEPLAVRPLRERPTALERAISSLIALLDEGAHAGLRFVSTDYPERLRLAASELEGAGLTATSPLVLRLADSHHTARSATTDLDDANRLLARSFLSVSLRAQLLRESL